MKPLNRIPYKRIINSPKFHQAIMRYEYLMQNKNNIDETYEFYFCELYDLKPNAFKGYDYVQFRKNYFKQLKKFVNNPTLMPQTISEVIDILKTPNNPQESKVFASKLMHTVNPKDYPVWDKWVCNKNHYNVSITKTKTISIDDRYNNYKKEVKMYCQQGKKDSDTMINAFTNNNKYKNLPINIERDKIIDFILWQDR